MPAPSGTIHWTFNSGPQAFDFLATGETLELTYTIRATDSDASHAFDDQTVVITITGTNDAPVNTVPGAQSADEDTSLAISGVSVADIDSSPLTTTLHVGHGTLNVAASGASVTGANSGTVTLSGTAAQINIALAGLTYTGSANYSGPDTLSVQTTDGSLSDSDNVAITVNPVADAPTLIVSGSTPVAIAGEFRVNSQTSNAQINPSVAALTDGGFVVTWQSQNQGSDGGYGIYGQRYDASGQTVGLEFHANTYTTSDQTIPAVLGLAGGGFVVTWASLGRTAQHRRWRIRASTARSTAPTAIRSAAEFHANAYFTAAYQSTPALAALPNGGFVATWESYGQDGNGDAVIAQRFDASGHKVGSEFVVNSYTNSEQFGSAIATADDGSFVITWHSFGQTGNSTYDVYAQRYNANGTTAGSEFQVNTTIASSQTDPSVAVLHDGSFVITWQSPDVSGNGIFARHYAANGTALSGEVAVNTFTSGDQSTANVVALPNGGYLISWMSNGQDGSGRGIYGQAFDASGNSVGSEFRISQSTVGQQEVGTDEGGAPVAVLASGNIVQVWDGAPQIAGSNEIYARLLATPASGTEDHSVQLPAITTALTDTDGSETLVLHLTGFPTGATFSVGALDVPSGHWLISGASTIAALATTPLTMTPPADYNGSFILHVGSVVTDTATLTRGRPAPPQRRTTSP